MSRKKVIVSLSENNISDLFQGIKTAGSGFNVGINPKDRDTINAFVNGKAQPTFNVNVELAPETAKIIDNGIKILAGGAVGTALVAGFFRLLKR